MADPRLNSIHLEGPRRQEYRQAREMLLQARGWQTIAAEASGASAPPAPAPPESADGPHTLLPSGNPPAVPPTVQYWLVDRDAVYPLKVGLNTVGRSADNDVVLADGYVSRRHCAIVVHLKDGCELHDTASKNGTFLNGQKLGGPTRLQTGDEIRMCDRQVVFMSRAGEADQRFDSHTIVE